MASSKGQVTLRGRFAAGSVVTLTRVAHEGVLRPEGGEDVDTQTVEVEDGVAVVRFSKGVEPGARYIAHGISDGVPLQVRLRGRTADDPSEVLEQAPIGPDRTRFADGSFVDSTPTKESAPNILAAQADIRHVKKGTVLRSDTPRGEAHPVDVDRQEPVRRQEDVPDGVVQMSDTKGVPEGEEDVRRQAGEATEIVLGPQRQEDVPDGVFQRSDTPTGVAQPLPAGDAVHQAEVRESSAARESRGDFARAGAEPLEPGGKAKAGPPKGASQKDSEKRTEELAKSEREAKTAGGVLAGTVLGPDQPAEMWGDRSGYDAMGQPAYPDVAAAAGVEAPDKARVDAPGADTAASIKDRDSEESGADVRKRTGLTAKERSERSRKAAETRRRNEEADQRDTGDDDDTPPEETPEPEPQQSDDRVRELERELEQARQQQDPAHHTTTPPITGAATTTNVQDTSNTTANETKE